MDTPVYDFVKEYCARDAVRLHMPGHKGVAALGPEPMDITEMEGADVLYHSQGILRRSEENAAALFGTARTVYSAEGSSLSIRGMLYLLMLYGKRHGHSPLIAAGRNAHKVFLTASALLGLDIAWIYPEKRESLTVCEITGEMLDRFLSRLPEKPIAVYITSPDYLGNVADIPALSSVCRRHGVLLAVDNAHGAYLRFLPEDRHPISLGADLCCDSAHKTLPVLTGGGYLHISNSAPEELREQAEFAMAMFASTSPSYLILQSLDRANRYLTEGYRERLESYCGDVSALKGRLASAGFSFAGTEPLKITLRAKPYGYTGMEAAVYLKAWRIVCEYADPDYLVLMLTPECGSGALSILEKALLSMPAKTPLPDTPLPFTIPLRKLSPREAMLFPSREVPVEESLGKILAAPTVSCPPAVPVVVSGEMIDSNAIRVMQYYGITACRVADGQRAEKQEPRMENPVAQRK